MPSGLQDAHICCPDYTVQGGDTEQRQLHFERSCPNGCAHAHEAMHACARHAFNSKDGPSVVLQEQSISILLPVVGIEACLVARSQIRAQFQLPDDLTEEEKLEPVRNFGDDPKIRLLNRLYEKKRKVNALPRLDISCCKADWGKRGHAGRQRNSGQCGSSRRWRALMGVSCS